MAEAKTKPTSASVEEYLASKASPEQLADCKALMALLKKATKHSPKMWGPSIVGYGSYGYGAYSRGYGYPGYDRGYGYRSYRRDDGRDDDAALTIAGGVIGGLIGNHAASPENRAAGTVFVPGTISNNSTPTP